MQTDDSKRNPEGVWKSASRSGEAMLYGLYSIQDAIGAVLIVHGECGVYMLHFISGIVITIE
jgi:hypothetical protein